MTTRFMMGGSPVYILDLSVERDAPRCYTEETKSFAQRAQDEAQRCSQAEVKHKFFTVYSESCTDMTTNKAEKLFRLSLAGQSYTYSKHRIRVIMANGIMVFYQTNGKLVPLWELHPLQSNKSYPFLNPKELLSTLKKIFRSVKLSLGKLSVKNIPCIAWKVETNEGVFYIPWHNGCVIEEQENFLFEEKTLNELKGIYTLLRFSRSIEQPDTYKIVCC